MWEKYDESQMGIFVRNIKRYFKIHVIRVLHASSSYSSALPDYVFDEGERQPRQALKRPKTGKVRVGYSPVSFHWLLILLITTYHAT